MLILQPGRERPIWSREVECTGAGNGGDGCGARLLVEEDDLFRTYAGARVESHVRTTFECCACGALTSIKGVPPGIIDSLVEK